MSFAEEMMNLGEKLLTSCDNRLHNNKERIKNTRGMLNRFHLDNKRTARELHNNLTEFTDNLAGNVNKMCRKFRNEHKEMKRNYRENMDEFQENLSDNVKNTLKNARGFVRKCHKDQMGTHNMFIQAHKNFANCMKEIERKKRHPHRFSGEEFAPSPKKRGRKKRTRH